MMDKWLKKSTPGDKGLTRPPSSARVSTHTNEVRSITHGEKVTNVFTEHYTLPTDTNELPNSNEIQVTLGKEDIRLIRMRQGVSSDSDEQVGSSSRSTVTQD
jgi:hypothetical protein